MIVEGNCFWNLVSVYLVFFCRALLLYTLRWSVRLSCIVCMWNLHALQLLKWFLMKGWLYLKHGSIFLDVGVGRIGCCGVRDVVLGLCPFLIYEICDQLVLLLWARKTSCWFACPLSLSLFIAKFNACCGVRNSDSKTIWIDVLFRLDIRRSFTRSSSSFSNLLCGPAPLSLL